MVCHVRCDVLPEQKGAHIIAQEKTLKDLRMNMGAPSDPQCSSAQQYKMPGERAMEFCSQGHSSRHS